MSLFCFTSIARNNEINGASCFSSCIHHNDLFVGNFMNLIISNINSQSKSENKRQSISAFSLNQSFHLFHWQVTNNFFLCILSCDEISFWLAQLFSNWLMKHHTIRFLNHITLKTECCCNGNFVVTGGKAGCRCEIQRGNKTLLLRSPVFDTVNWVLYQLSISVIYITLFSLNVNGNLLMYVMQDYVL